MSRWWLVALGLVAAAAQAESRVAVGSTGKLSASATINIKVVIPAVLGLNDQARVISNGGPRDIVVRSHSYEGFTEYASADWASYPSQPAITTPRRAPGHSSQSKY